jgi:acylpyruvate hydrolase
MRLAMHRREGVPTPALVLADPASGDVLVDLAAVTSVAVGAVSVTELLPHLDELRGALGGVTIDSVEPSSRLRVEDADLLPPVGAGGQLIVCCGFNYASHEAEVQASSVGATWFIKSPNCVTGPGAAVTVPSGATTVDYEGELAIVFGRDCHRVSAVEALDVVAGYTLVNDVSVRWLGRPDPADTDAVRRSVIDTQLGKQHPDFCPVGPYLVGADEVADPSRLTFTTELNGELVQQARLTDMRLGVPELIEWLSSVFEFRAGDMISTGSPAGSGVSQRPPRFLGQGDVVTVSAEAFGSLSNHFITTDDPRSVTTAATSTRTAAL